MLTIIQQRLTSKFYLRLVQIYMYPAFTLSYFWNSRSYIKVTSLIQIFVELSDLEYFKNDTDIVALLHVFKSYHDEQHNGEISRISVV